MTDPALQQDFAEDVVLLKLVGMNPVVVHGGGPQIEEALAKIGKKGTVHPGHARHRRRDDGSRRVGARRPGAAGHRRPDQRRRRQGGGPDRPRRRPDPRAASCSMVDRNDPSKEHDVGQVGEIESIDPSVVKALQDDQFIPVISPLGFGDDNENYNINADVVAGKLAEVLKAEKLMMLTNTPGVLDKSRQAAHRPDARARSTSCSPTAPSPAACCRRSQSALDAAKNGVNTVHIIDGRVPHAMLLEVLTEQAYGTMIRSR